VKTLIVLFIVMRYKTVRVIEFQGCI